MLRGSCLCGGITFAVTGPVLGSSACHCGQCRKMSGHVWSDADVALADIVITGEPRWYEASEKVRRGFCPVCGAFLFWQAKGSHHIAFSLGAVDGPTGLTLGRHIFTAEKADYLDLGADGVERR